MHLLICTSQPTVSPPLQHFSLKIKLCHLSSGNDFRRLFSKFWAIVSYITPTTSRLLESEFLDMFLQSLIYLLWMSKWTNYFHPVLIARLKQNQVGFLSVTYLSSTKRIEVFLKSMSCITRSHVVDGRRILLLT